MIRSTLIALAAIMAVNAFAQPVEAATEYPWCAQYGRWGGGGRNCGFVSFQQCMATVSGIGGFCERNGFYIGSSSRRVHRKERHR